MELTIAVLGLTREQLDLLEATMPKEYTVMTAECATDLILTDAVLSIVNAEKLNQADQKILTDYNSETGETVVWLGKPAASATNCFDSIADLLPVVEKVLEQAQEQYDSQKICSSEYGLLPKRTLEESMENTVWDLLRGKYGDEPGPFLCKRVRQEWTALLEVDAIPDLAAAHELSMWLRRTNTAHYAGGNATSGFIPFLLGITRVNPLPEDYGGHNLVWQEYCSYGRVPTYGFHVPQNLRPQIEIWKEHHWMKSIYPDHWETEYWEEPDAWECGSICVYFDAEEAAVPDMSILCREDIFFYLKKHGFVDKDAFRGMCSARKGRGLPVITEEMRTADDSYFLQQIESVRYAPSRGNLIEQKHFAERKMKGKKQRILIADSSESFARSLAREIVKAGEYEVVGIALDGEQAIEQIRTHKPDVLLLDLMLARFDGLTVLELTDNVVPKPIVIASSMFISDYVKNSCKRLRVKFLLRRPCSISDLLCWIKKAKEE